MKQLFYSSCAEGRTDTEMKIIMGLVIGALLLNKEILAKITEQALASIGQ